ncbi:MCM DNA helicase complex subunit MCM2 [Sugiyamaella lignohabitans]|uniref:DNA replication licensing factor MCM2 n=1 Tax=Sugiyamaella lignohabitans TaxID=796027 RepID=A0A161HFQ0_9ASCO|nr:MCM DNA helicase complex subunit MCM2 [Sugiyamaella lignohabitans]ANB14420.1 MCM DNA helicase complex subunit MCM2 [Sugiyamaella lignohabitans]
MSGSRKRDRRNSEDFRGEPPSSPNLPMANLASSPPAFEDEDELIQEDVIDDLDELAEEEAGEDLFGDNMERDYMESRQNDQYDLGDQNIDDNEYDDLDISARRQVDAQLNRRDRQIRNQRGLPDAFLDDGDGYDDLVPPTTRRRRNQYDEDLAMDNSDDDDPMNEILSLESLGDVKAESIAEWVSQPSVHRSVAREFKNFLLEYTDENGRSVYGNRIRTLGEVNSESLEIVYTHLVESKATLAYFLAVAPTEILKIFDVVAMEAIELHYPEYSRIHAEVHVRISGLPTTFTLRDLRENHLNSLVRVTGVVTRRTGVFPQLKYVKFNCPKCGMILGPYFQDSNTEVTISFCHSCQSRGPFILNSEKTVYRNYQKITLQESPGTVPAGRLPRHREVILLWDLIDVAKPGEEVDITGIYKNSYDGGLNAKNGFPVFATVIEANLVQRREAGKTGDFTLTEEEEREIRTLAKSKDIINTIIRSIAPSIYGHKDIKTALACSLFGGVAKRQEKHTVRGDINVLLLGDPGTAKSQLLKYVEKTAHRAVFATGQGASAVGLTASVRKDPITREWTLEGGALVLADKGTCLIDEFDKMNDQDRTSIHEAMEQQSISISKAGIVTSLQARCAVIAAANPNGGRYNSTIPFAANVDLTEPILSRFDVLCVVRDTVDPEVDEMLAKFVVTSHTKNHPLDPGEGNSGLQQEDEDDDMGEEEEEDLLASLQPNAGATISQELLRKYIHYARTKFQPRLSQQYEGKIGSIYSEIRQYSRNTGSFPITVRHLESIIRLSESFAKMRLSENVSEGDVNRAISVTIDSFVGAQKSSLRRSLRRSLMKYTYNN